MLTLLMVVISTAVLAAATVAGARVARRGWPCEPRQQVVAWLVIWAFLLALAALFWPMR